jgi:hypothetical protein
MRQNAARNQDSGIRAIHQKPARAPRTVENMGVVAQVRAALKPSNRLAFGLGATLGSFVPVASYWLAHHEIDRADPFRWGSLLPAFLVLGGLVFSASTVFAWGRRTFGSARKALGYCVLTEGVLLASHTDWLALGALAYLVAINAVATGTRLSLDR